MVSNFDDALFEACHTGDTSQVRKLLDQGAAINHCYSWGSPVRMATIGGHDALIRELVSQGADVDLVCDLELGPALAAAAEGSFHLTDTENLAILDLLLKLGANPNLVFGQRQLTPLHTALMHERDECACRLLEAGADPYLADRNGANAFDYAVHFKLEKVIDLLTEIGGSPYREKIEQARLSCELRDKAYGGDLLLVKKLLKANADINAVDHDGWDPLRAAAYQGDTKMLQFLLDHGADPNNIKHDKSALLEAATNAHQEAFELLLDAGADVNATIEMAPGAFADVVHFANSTGKPEFAKYVKSEIKRRKLTK